MNPFLVRSIPCLLLSMALVGMELRGEEPAESRPAQVWEGSKQSSFTFPEALRGATITPYASLHGEFGVGDFEVRSRVESDFDFGEDLDEPARVRLIFEEKIHLKGGVMSTVPPFATNNFSTLGVGEAEMTLRVDRDGFLYISGSGMIHPRERRRGDFQNQFHRHSLEVKSLALPEPTGVLEFDVPETLIGQVVTHLERVGDEFFLVMETFLPGATRVGEHRKKIPYHGVRQDGRVFLPIFVSLLPEDARVWSENPNARILVGMGQCLFARTGYRTDSWNRHGFLRVRREPVSR